MEWTFALDRISLRLDPVNPGTLIGAILTMVAATSLGQPWRPCRSMGAGVVGWGSASGVLAAGVLGERIGAAQRKGIGICVLAVATLALG